MISNTTSPTLDAVGQNTPVTYNAGANQTIADAVYHNLTLSGSGTKFFQPNAASITNIANNLNISAGVTAQNQGNNVVIGGSSTGLSNNGAAMGIGTYTYSLQDVQTNIAGNGTYSNLEIDAGSSDNRVYTISLSSPVAVSGSLYLTNGTLANGTQLTMAPGSMIYIGEGALSNSLSSTGYDVTYLSAQSTTLATGHELSGQLRNLTLQVPDGATLTLNRNLTLSGNLVLNSGTFDPSSYSITLGGNFTNGATLASRNTIFTFNGNSIQRIGGNAPISFYQLRVQQVAGGNLYLDQPVTVNHTLTLTNGIVHTSATNKLTLRAGATLAGGSSSSYISGPLVRTFNTTTGTQTFPIGKDNAYRPLTLSVTLNTTGPTAFSAEVFTGAPPVRSLTTGLHNLSSIRYYTVNPDNSTNISSATITLPYEVDEGVVNPANLRIAKSSGNNWVDIGGSGSATGSGTITSTPFSSFSDFVLANTKSYSVLPLTWINFTALTKASTIVLNWQTAQEQNTADFKVERSIDGQHWTGIATLKSHNQASNDYSYTDAVPVAVSFYRILQRDQDGKFSYSKTIKVQFQAQTGRLTLLPSIISSGNVSAMIQDEALLQSSRVQIRLIDLSGKLVYSNSRKPASVLNVTVSGLSPGRYVLVVNNESKQIQAQLMVQ